MAEGQVVAPVYSRDIRVLFRRTYATPGLVFMPPIPGGPLADRVAQFSTFARRRHGALRASEAGDAQAVLKHAEYWPLAIADRLLIQGVLGGIADAALSPAEASAVEREVLRVYREVYTELPLPEDVLWLLLECHTGTPESGLLVWLQEYASELRVVHSLEEANELRSRRRLAALTLGAELVWPEPITAAAELCCDIFMLCRVAALDLEQAEAATAPGTSIAATLRSMENEGDTRIETALRLVLNPIRSPADGITPDSYERLQDFARTRPRRADGLLVVPAKPAAKTVKALVSVPEKPDIVRSAREIFAELHAALERTIIGRRELVHRLALVALEHLLTPRSPRLLLAGPSGSGKSHIARAIATAVGQSFVHLDASAVTGRGWRGVELESVIDDLVRGCKGNPPTGVILLDEFDKLAIGRGTDSNSREAKFTAQVEFLSILSGSEITTESGRQIDTSRILVVAAGAFGAFGHKFTESPSTTALYRYGLLFEVAARFDQKLLVVEPGIEDGIELLRRGDRSISARLGPLLEALSISTDVSSAVYRYVEIHRRTIGADYRSAADWLLSAMRRRVIECLRSREDRIVLSPDDLELPH